MKPHITRTFCHTKKKKQKIGTFSSNAKQKLPKFAEIKKLSKGKSKILRNWRAWQPNPKFLTKRGVAIQSDTLLFLYIKNNRRKLFLWTLKPREVF